MTLSSIARTSSLGLIISIAFVLGSSKSLFELAIPSLHLRSVFQTELFRPVPAAIVDVVVPAFHAHSITSLSPLPSSGQSKPLPIE